MNLNEGTLLQGNKYKIVRFIKSGGFGNTYEGIHVLLKKRVAIKEFFVKDFCNRDEATAAVTVGITAKAPLVSKLKEKFLEEAQFVSSLKHPNIVNVYDVFEENGTAYYVMDYIDGSSLNDIVETGGPLAEADALHYIRQVAEALKYVHSRNRLHLDVKPGNVMVDTDGNALLIDFGSSKQYDEVAGENTSTLMGMTPGYASPEQTGHDVVKFFPATDIYALGATLYKLLTGKTPLSSNLLSSGEELDPIPATISAAVRNAVAKSMLSNKKVRPQTVDEFLNLLTAKVDADVTAMLSDETINPADVTLSQRDMTVNPIGARFVNEVAKPSPEREEPQRPTTPPAPPTPPAPAPRNNKKVIVAFVCAIIVGAVCVFGYQSLGNSSGPDEPPTSKVDDGGSKKNDGKATAKTQNVTGQQFKDAVGQSFTYTGEVQNGKPNGKGSGVYSYGHYTGEYKDGLRHGQGNFESKDGSNKYVGTFVNDQYDTGKLTMKDGYYFEGKFKDGQPYNGNWYEKTGQFNSKVVNGK